MDSRGKIVGTVVVVAILGAAIAGGSGNSIGEEIGKSVGKGVGTGLFTMLMITLLALPVSYFMNSYIYHGGVMRFMVGLLAAIPLLGFVAATIARVAGTGKIHYFGMFPLQPERVYAGGDSPLDWIMNIFFKVVNLFLHPIMYVMTGDSRGAFEELLRARGFIVDPTTHPVVNEELFEGARLVGSIANKDKWLEGIKALTPLASAMYQTRTPQ